MKTLYVRTTVFFRITNVVVDQHICFDTVQYWGRTLTFMSPAAPEALCL